MIKQVLLVVLLIFSTMSVSASESVAMILDLNGKANLTRDNANLDVAILDSLFPKDVLKLAADSTATLIYTESGQEYQLTGGTSYLISRDKLSQVDGKPVEGRKNDALDKLQQVQLDNKGVAMAGLVLRAGMRNSKQLSTHNYFGSIMLDRQVPFTWTKISSLKKYQFQLISPQGLTLHSVSPEKNRYRLPENVQLKPGKVYTWVVEATQSDNRLLNTWGYFRVADALDRQNYKKILDLDNSTFAKRVLQTRLLDQAGFIDQAKPRWLKLKAEKPALRLPFKSHLKP